MRILSLVVVLFLFCINSVQADDYTANLGTLVVEGSRSNDTTGQMNQAVSIITSDDIAKLPGKNLMEILSTVPGAYSNQLSNIKNQQIDLGGFGATSISNVLVLVDGMRLNEPDQSGADLSLIDVNSIDHIEVIQGNGTVLYGDNAAGGVINIVTKKGKKNAKPSVTLTSEVDSYKGNKDGVTVSGGLPKLSYYFDYDRQQNDGYRSHSDYWANDYDSRLDYNPTDIFGIDFAQGYHLDRYRLPGGLTRSEIDQLGPTGVESFNENDYGTTSDSHFDVTPHFKFDVGNSSGEFSLFTSARKRDNNSYVVFYDGGPLEEFAYETESYEFQPKVIIKTPLTDRLDNKLTSGYDYIYNKENRRIYSVGSPEDTVDAREASQSVYMLDELTLDDRWLLNAGARGGWTNFVFDQTEQTPTKFDRSATTEGFDGGLGYKYNPDSKIFVDYSHSYRLPILDEFFQSPFENGVVDNPATIISGLTYQAGNQYQLGIKDQSFNGIHLGFTATEAQYKNEIYYDPATGFNANYGGRTRHYSEEADAAVDLFNKKIQPFANVTFQQTEFIKGNYSGHAIPFVPDQIAHAGITYFPLKGLSTSMTTNFVGKRFLDGDFTSAEPKLKRYETIDWNVKYGFKNVEVWFSLQNILNTKYSAYGVTISPGSDFYYPAPGRNMEAGIKVKF